MWTHSSAGTWENDLHPGESGVLGQEARMHDMHIDVAWRPLVVADNMD